VAELLRAGLDQLARASEAVRTLETVPGVGPRTAEAVAACLHDPHRFRSGKQVSAYAGLVPRQFQSGDRGGRITRRGPALLRKLLVECAWVMLRYNAWARAVYLRLSRGQARTKQAIVALAPRLAFGAWFFSRGRNWDALPNPLSPFGFTRDGRPRTVAWQRLATNNHAADDGQPDGPRPAARARLLLPPYFPRLASNALDCQHPDRCGVGPVVRGVGGPAQPGGPWRTLGRERPQHAAPTSTEFLKSQLRPALCVPTSSRKAVPLLWHFTPALGSVGWLRAPPAT
jgi:hypothetical protein